MALTLNGSALAATIRGKIKERVAALEQKPGLAVILVGDDPASHVYVGLKQKACEEVGIHFEDFLFPKETPEKELIKKIEELNARKDIHGILVQLPLPMQDADRIIEAINPKKDVDGFHPDNLKQLRIGKPALAPAVALGIMKLVDVAFETLGVKNRRQKHATIVGSDLFAEPLRILLHEQGITSDVTNVDEPYFKKKTTRADILIVAVGKPLVITNEFVKPDAIVIDVGTTKIDGKLVGDVDRQSLELLASAVSPVPGGVGPMTVAMLMLNVLKAASSNKKISL